MPADFDQATYLVVLAAAKQRSKIAERAIYVLDIIDVKASGLLSFLGAIIAGILFYLNMIAHSQTIGLAVRLFALLSLATVGVASGLAVSCIFIIGKHQRESWVDGFRPGDEISDEGVQRVQDGLVATSATRTTRYMWALRLTYAAGGLMFISLFAYYADLKIVAGWL